MYPRGPRPYLLSFSVSFPLSLRIISLARVRSRRPSGRMGMDIMHCIPSSSWQQQQSARPMSWRVAMQCTIDWAATSLSAKPYVHFCMLHNAKPCSQNLSLCRNNNLSYRLQTALSASLSVLSTAGMVWMSVWSTQPLGVAYIQEWVTANATKQDGLLHELIGSVRLALQTSLGSEDLPPWQVRPHFHLVSRVRERERVSWFTSPFMLKMH